MAKPSNKPANKTANKKGAGCSLANVWEVTDPTEASNNLTLGEQQARLADVKVNNNPEKGLAVFLKWEGLAEESTEGLSSSQMYRISDSTGAKAAGAAYLMRDLAILGYPDIKPAKIEAKLKEIAEEGIIALVNVKQSGDYTNVYVQGLPVDAEVDADDADDAEEEAVELEVGDKVTWDDGDQSGTIAKIKGDVATVEDADEDLHKIDLSDLTKAEEETEETEDAEEEAAEESELEVGDDVTWDDGDESGTILKIVDDEATVKNAAGKKVKVDLSDLTKAEEEAEEEEVAEIEVGSKVKWQDDNGDDKEGEVTKIKGDILYIEDEGGDVIKVDSSETTVELDN